MSLGPGALLKNENSLLKELLKAELLKTGGTRRSFFLPGGFSAPKSPPLQLVILKTHHWNSFTHL